MYALSKERSAVSASVSMLKVRRCQALIKVRTKERSFIFSNKNLSRTLFLIILRVIDRDLFIYFCYPGLVSGTHIHD